jgi:PAS domain-containing protein
MTSTYRSRERVERAAMLQRTTELFQEREAFTQAILNSVPSEIVVLSRNGTIVAVNEAWRRFASDNRPPSGALPRRTEVGANYLAVCAESRDTGGSEAMAPLDGIKAVLNGSLRLYTHEYPCHAPHAQRWFLMQVTPFEGPKIVGAVINHTDITQHKLAERSQQETREQLQLVIDASDDGFWDWQVSSGLVMRSPRYLALVGAQPEEDSGDFAFFKSTVHPDDLPHVMRCILAHQQSQTPSIAFEYRLARPTAEVQWLRVKGRVVSRDANGAPLRLVGTLSDITGQKLAYLALREREQQLALALALAALQPGGQQA